MRAHNTGKNGWKRTTREKPCRLCGNRSGWCTESFDGNGIICGKTESPQQRSDGRWYHQIGRSERLSDIRMRPSVIHKTPARQINSDFKDFDAIQADAVQTLTQSDLEALRKSQGLPTVKSLKAIGAGKIEQVLFVPDAGHWYRSVSLVFV